MKARHQTAPPGGRKGQDMTRLAMAAAALALAGCGAPLLLGAVPVAGIATLQQKGPGSAVSDTGLRIAVNAALLSDSEPLFTSLSTEVVEGRVLLAGRVPSRADKVRALAVVWGVDGVNEVIDAISVADGQGAGAYATDWRITSELRSRLIGDAGIRSLNYNIETLDRTIHLMGLARDRSELDRVTRHAARVPGVARVVSHVYLYADPRRGARRTAPVL